MNDRTMTLRLGEHLVGDGQPCWIVAEIGINHNGELDLAKENIRAAASAGANAVKFQSFSAEEFLADPELKHSYRDAGNVLIEETQYAMFKRLELPAAWHAELQRHAREQNVGFFSSAADAGAADLLCSLGVPAIKLASEYLINIELLKHVARQPLPVILSAGMASPEEIAAALALFAHRRDLALLHCVSVYPTPAESLNLRRIQSLRREYGVLTGYSDHSVGIEAAAAAVCLGACMVEKHFTIDKRLPGPDHAFSASPDEFGAMVARIRLVERMLGDGDLNFADIERPGRTSFRRGIVAAAFIAAGQRIAPDLLAYKRPCVGLKPIDRELLLGRRARRDLAPNTPITLADVEGGEPC